MLYTTLNNSVKMPLLGFGVYQMLENGATRQQVADVIGVNVKTIYKYLPAT